MEPQRSIQRRVVALVVVPLAVITVLGVILLLPADQGGPDLRAMVAVVGFLVAGIWTTVLAIAVLQAAAAEDDTEDLSRLRQSGDQVDDDPSDTDDASSSTPDSVDGADNVPDRPETGAGLPGHLVTARARQIQELLDLQVARLDHLEQAEEAPGVLAELFDVDHLAIRAWRLAADLAVLADDEPPSYDGSPVPLETVARFALGQVEHYRRIDTTGVGEGSLPTEAATDLAQLTAILIDTVGADDPEAVLSVTSGANTTGTHFVLSIEGGRLSGQDRARWHRALTATQPEHPPIDGGGAVDTADRVVAVALARRLGCLLSFSSGDRPASLGTDTAEALTGTDPADDDTEMSSVVVQLDVPLAPGPVEDTTAPNGDDITPRSETNTVLEQLMGLVPVPSAEPPTSDRPRLTGVDALRPPTDRERPSRQPAAAVPPMPGPEHSAVAVSTEVTGSVVPGDDYTAPPPVRPDPDTDQPHPPSPVLAPHLLDPPDTGANLGDDETAAGPQDVPDEKPEAPATQPIATEPGSDQPVSPAPGQLADALPSGRAFDRGVESLLTTTPDHPPAPPATEAAQARAEALRDRLSTFRTGFDAGRGAGRQSSPVDDSPTAPASAPAPAPSPSDTGSFDLSWPSFDDRQTGNDPQ
jgi:hypothetical protein